MLPPLTSFQIVHALSHLIHPSENRISRFRKLGLLQKKSRNVSVRPFTLSYSPPAVHHITYHLIQHFLHNVGDLRPFLAAGFRGALRRHGQLEDAAKDGRMM